MNVKKTHVAYMLIHTHTLSRSNRREALCREVLLYLFFKTRFAVHLSNMRWKIIPCNIALHNTVPFLELCSAFGDCENNPGDMSGGVSVCVRVE